MRSEVAEEVQFSVSTIWIGIRETPSRPQLGTVGVRQPMLHSASNNQRLIPIKRFEALIHEVVIREVGLHFYLLCCVESFNHDSASRISAAMSVFRCIKSSKVFLDDIEQYPKYLGVRFPAFYKIAFTRPIRATFISAEFTTTKHCDCLKRSRRRSRHVLEATFEHV